MIILFETNSNIKGEKDRELAKKYYLMYMNLLRRYLESLYGRDSDSIFATIPLTLKDLNVMGQIAETVFVGKVQNEEAAHKLSMEFFKTRTDELPNPTSSSA